MNTSESSTSEWPGLGGLDVPAMKLEIDEAPSAPGPRAAAGWGQPSTAAGAAALGAIGGALASARTLPGSDLSDGIRRLEDRLEAVDPDAVVFEAVVLEVKKVLRNAESSKSEMRGLLQQVKSGIKAEQDTQLRDAPAEINGLAEKLKELGPKLDQIQRVLGGDLIDLVRRSSRAGVSGWRWSALAMCLDTMRLASASNDGQPSCGRLDTAVDLAEAWLQAHPRGSQRLHRVIVMTAMQVLKINAAGVQREEVLDVDQRKQELNQIREKISRRSDKVNGGDGA